MEKRPEGVGVMLCVFDRAIGYNMVEEFYN